MLEPGRGAASDPVKGKAQAQGEVTERLSIADLEQAAANYESAIRTYRQALDGKPGAHEKALALLGIGTCLERLGRWKESFNVLEDALRSAEETQEDILLARVQVELGKIHLGRGNVDAALKLGQASLVLTDVDYPSARGFSLNLLGTAYNRRGDLDQSASCFERALSAFKEAGDIKSLAFAYNNLGLVCKQKCDWQKALEYLQVAASLQAIEGDYPERRMGLHNLGLVHFRIGHWDRARECFSESLRISREVNDPLGIIRGLLATSGVELVQRRWHEALGALEQSLELCSEERYPQETALTYRSLGQLHQARGDLTRARRCLEVAWRKAVEVSEEGDLARELLRLRADLALEEGQVADAANLAKRAVNVSRRSGDKMETALALISLGRVHLEEENDQGFDLFHEAYEMLKALGSPLPVVQLLIEEGRLRLELAKDPVRAETALTEALESLQGLELPDVEVETLIYLARVATVNGDLNGAGDYLDRARNRAQDTDHQETGDLLAETQKDLETRLVDASVANLGAFRTAGRLEEVVESRSPYVSKVHDVLDIMAQAVEADGAALVMTSDKLPGGTYRIGTASEQRLAALLRRHHPERPEIVLDATTVAREPWGEIAEARKAKSLLVVPIYGNGMTAYLYLDRLQETVRSAFGPTHLNICLALVPQLEALVDRVSLEAVRAPEEDSLRRRTFLADVVTQNPEMIEILKLAEKINRTDLTILLQGETGTGKTLIARAIHLSSNRSEGPFVTVDCAALPENLLESELFGYVQGAFTGASGDKKGLFEEADGGTIFLDEVGRAGLGVQRRLLHLLDMGEVRPVGSTSYRKLNVRVICATSAKNLLSNSEHGPFIKDLYYRLNDIIIHVPSLRDRPEDIPLLAEYFLETMNGETSRKAVGITRSAMQRLVRYSWPGNVRELEKAVRRASILSEEGESIGPALLPQEVLTATESLPKATGTGDVDLRSTVEGIEQRLVLEALHKHGWNKTRAAQELGLSRKGLKNKIARYGLTPPTP